MTKGRKELVLVNDIREAFSEEWFGREEQEVWPLWIDDIVSGVARLDWYGNREQQIPLATSSIIQCFLHLDKISTSSVMQLLELKERMARKYSVACRLSYPILKRSLEDISIKTMRYRNISIVSEKHGIHMGYESDLS